MKWRFMIKKQFVIIDKDIRYLERVQDYLTKKRLSDFQIMVYTGLEQAVSDSQTSPFEIAVISENCYQEAQIQELCVMHVFVLKESAESIAYAYPVLAKYQSMEEIIKQILAVYTKELGESILIKRGKRAKVLSFYTRGGSKLQTLYALAAGELLTREQKKVLYVNLQPFSGLEFLLKHEFQGDLTDVIYYGLQHSEKFGSRIDICKHVFRDISVLPPIEDYTDLLSLAKEEWKEWLAGMVYDAGYEILIVDFSGLSPGVEVFFADSDVIYQTEAADAWENACQSEVENWLYRKGLAESKSHTKLLPVQKVSETETETLLYGAIGIAMKDRLIKDGFLKNE